MELAAAPVGFGLHDICNHEVPMKPLLPFILLPRRCCLPPLRQRATTARDAVLGEEVKNADGTASVDTCGARPILTGRPEKPRHYQGERGHPIAPIAKVMPSMRISR